MLSDEALFTVRKAGDEQHLYRPHRSAIAQNAELMLTLSRLLDAVFAAQSSPDARLQHVSRLMISVGTLYRPGWNAMYLANIPRDVWECVLNQCKTRADVSQLFITLKLQ
jgi:hypothetical protein